MIIYQQLLENLFIKRVVKSTKLLRRSRKDGSGINPRVVQLYFFPKYNTNI